MTILPTIVCAEKQISIVDAIVKLGFAKSNSEAKRLIKQGAVRIYPAKEKQCA